jgi:hypothetical protein
MTIRRTADLEHLEAHCPGWAEKSIEATNNIGMITDEEWRARTENPRSFTDTEVEALYNATAP